MNNMTDDMFEDLWTNLVSRSAEDASNPLTRDERIFYSINLLRGSVPRSGLLGYFELCTQRDIKDALEGLTELHLNEVALILRTALNEVVGDTPLSDELTSVQIVSPSLNEEEYIQECDRIAAGMQPLEKQLIDLDSAILYALCQFASQRINPTV
jgi:hypothetical protein